MSTLVAFHAHPDDEAIATSGAMAQAKADGHRVVLVVATRGEQGEPQPGVLAEGEPLWQRRVEETHESAKIIGADAVHFLGYEDSGMMGEPTNDNPVCFWQADVAEATERLAGILRDEGCTVLLCYDEHGGYGHPDHIQVHRVGHAAADAAGVERVFQSTMNRDRIREMIANTPPEAFEAGEEAERDVAREDFGSPEAQITHALDVSSHIGVKRSCMEAHRSQIGDDSFFMKMPPEIFTAAFGTEWYIRTGHPRSEGGAFSTSLFED